MENEQELLESKAKAAQSEFEDAETLLSNLPNNASPDQVAEVKAMIEAARTRWQDKCADRDAYRNPSQ